MQRSLVISIFAVVLATASIAVASVALERKPNDRVDAQITSLSRQVHELAGEVNSVSAQEVRQQARMMKLLTCIPELVGEINGLTPEVTGGSVFLAQHSQISNYCGPILEASGR